MKLKNFLPLFLIIVCPSFLMAQDLDDMLGDLEGPSKQEVAYMFKSTHIVNGQSVERMTHRQLDFRINHRFGQLNSGLYELYGLDNALINFSFDYGVTDWLQLGIRRGTSKKTYDASLKWTITRQYKGAGSPVAISYYVDASANTLQWGDSVQDLRSNRLAYTHQLLIAKKFNEKLSLQLTPSFVHRNLVPKGEPNDVIALGFGGRYKMTRRVALIWEYFYADHTSKIDGYYNPLALGLDIETGGHVFQVFITNSRYMLEKGVITETTGSITDGGLYFGFNMSRVFAVKKWNKEKKEHKEHNEH